MMPEAYFYFKSYNSLKLWFVMRWNYFWIGSGN